MSIKDYVDTIAPTPTWLKKAHVHARRNGLDKLTTRDINRIIAGVRRERKPTKRAGK